MSTIPEGTAGLSVGRPTTAGWWRWLAFSAALAATMMDLVDSTIAHVAAPTTTPCPR